MKFNNLCTSAKINCMDQFVNIIVPYADYDGLSDGIECVIYDIEEWNGDQYWFDENGDWYDEGRKVRI